MTRRHPFEIVGYHGDPDDPVASDVEIVALIRAIWVHELDAELWCQDDDGYVWVEFDGPSATDFLNLVSGDDGELRSHMLHSVPFELADPDGFDAYVREHGWTYSLLPWRGWGDDPDEVRFLVSVRFPAATFLRLTLR